MNCDIKKPLKIVVSYAWHTTIYLTNFFFLQKKILHGGIFLWDGTLIFRSNRATMQKRKKIDDRCSTLLYRVPWGWKNETKFYFVQCCFCRLLNLKRENTSKIVFRTFSVLITSLITKFNWVAKSILWK